MPRFAFRALSFVLTVVMASLVAQAEEREKPTAQEGAKLLQCLKGKRRAEKSEEECIFSMVDACMEKPSSHTTLGQRLCNAREIVVWDELLNSRYKRLRKAISENGEKKLKQIQRSWISWRKAKCEMPYILFEGGTMAGPLAAGCLLKATAVRAVELGSALESMGEKP